MYLLYLGVISLCLFTGYIFGRRDKAYTELKSFIEHHGFAFRILVSIVLFIVLVLSAVYLHGNLPNNRFDSAEFAKYILSGLVVIGLLYTVLTFEITVKKNKEDRRSQLSQSTFKILTTWYNEPLISHSKTIDSFERTIEYEHLKTDLPAFMIFYDNALNNDSIELRKAIKGILNYLEIISAGIKEGVIDDGFVKRYFIDIFIAYYDDWNVFITNRRQNNPDIFIEFTTLAERWISEKQ